MSKSTWVGLDVHQDSITAAILRDDSNVPEIVRLSGDLMKVRCLFRRLAAEAPVHSCYEASGAGFVLHRVLADDGFHCEVIASSLIPKKPGDRRKTDRLDAVNLAYLYRGGHFTSIEIFDASGTLVRRLDQGVREAGSYRAEWDGRDAANRSVGSGVYFCRLSGGKSAETRKMVLVK